MSDPKEILQDRLTSLQKDFVSDVKNRINSIKDSWQRARNSNCKSEEFYELIHQVHTLYSSGTTLFGFNPLTEVAHKLDSLLKCLYDKEYSLSEEHCAQIEVMIQALEHTSSVEKNHKRNIQNKFWSLSKNVLIPEPNKKVIFLVDSDKVLSMKIATMLELNGYIVNVFNQLQDIKNTIIEISPSLIIMDMMLSEGKHAGAKFLFDIKHRINTDLKIIFISDYDDINARLQSVRAGSTHYLNKPLDFDKLLATVEEVTTEHVLNPYRVLIIDDDKPLSEFYAFVLKQAGLSITILNDPFDALIVMDEVRPELLLLDINMPECNGLELASIIRQQEKYAGISIIFLSAEAGYEQQLIAMDKGGDDYLTKPIKPDYLVTIVISRVNRARTLNNMATNLLSAKSKLENQHVALDKHAIISITDVNGIISYVNDQFIDISGYSRDELIGKNHNILNSGHHDKEFFAGIWSTVINNEIWQGEICNRNRNGEIYWLYTTIVPFMDERQMPYQYVSVHNDITSRVLAQNNLEMARDNAVNANEAKSDFLSRISHELRTPLNAILGFSQLLNINGDNIIPTTLKEYTNEIRMAGDHLLKLINELLDLSRIGVCQGSCRLSTSCHFFMVFGI
jgi:PAS domain S-box-containing protein